MVIGIRLPKLGTFERRSTVDSERMSKPRDHSSDCVPAALDERWVNSKDVAIFLLGRGGPPNGGYTSQSVAGVLGVENFPKSTAPRRRP